MQREDRDGMTPPERSPAAAGACASCKHQRKKCGGGCAMAPFFPGGVDEEYSCFREVHKLFGVSNVQKLISRLRKENKATETQLREAMDAVKWVARSWDREPFLGCRGEYKRLEETYSRLRYVIAHCRFSNHSSSATHEKTEQEVLLLPRPNSPIHHFHYQILLSNGDKDAMVSDCYLNGDGILLNVPRGGAPVSYVPGILEAQIGLGPVSHLPPLEKQLVSSTQFGFTVASSGVHAITNNHSLQELPQKLEPWWLNRTQNCKPVDQRQFPG